MENIESSILLGEISDSDRQEGLFKIYFNGVFAFYPIQKAELSDEEVISLIESLLNLEGDKRLCAISIKLYNPLSSQLYHGDANRYSIQLEALFLINQLYFDKPFQYSSYPVLVDKNGAYATIAGETIGQAFTSYKKWFGKVKAVGLTKAREQNLEPLESTDSVRWY